MWLLEYMNSYKKLSKITVRKVQGSACAWVYGGDL